MGLGESVFQQKLQKATVTDAGEKDQPEPGLQVDFATSE